MVSRGCGVTGWTRRRPQPGRKISRAHHSSPSTGVVTMVYIFSPSRWYFYKYWFCFSLEWNVASIFAIESQYSSCKIFREWLLQCGSLISQSILDGIAQYRMGVDSWISLASKPLDEHVRAILFSVPVRFLVCWYVVKGCCYCFCVEVWTLIPSSSRCDTPFLCKPRQC